MTLTAGEVCAGYGGLALAVEEVFGARTAWFSEFDDAPSKILKHHWPNVPNHGDMTRIDWAAIEQVDIISGGTPCQDLSHAGRRAGLTEGTRSNLWVNMREAIAIQRPTWVVWENVRGAYSAEADSDVEFCQGCMGNESDCNLRALGRVLGDLSDLGYDVQWRGLRASDVGAPHARFRVFVLARSRVSSYDAGCRGRPQAIEHDGSSQKARDRPGVSDKSGSHLDGPRPIRAFTSNRDHVGHERRRGSRGRWARLEDCSDLVADAESNGRHEGWTEQEGLVGRPHAAIGGGANWGDYEPAIRRWERVLGRPAPRPTEPTGRDGAERLSPRFTEWMMGLPDGWVTDPAIGISRNEQLKACGNGVVPQQAIAALRAMLAAFEKSLELAA